MAVDIRTRRAQRKTFFSVRRSQVRDYSFNTGQCPVPSPSNQSAYWPSVPVSTDVSKLVIRGTWRVPTLSAAPEVVHAGEGEGNPAARCADQTLVNDGAANIADFALRTAGRRTRTPVSANRHKRCTRSDTGGSVELLDGGVRFDDHTISMPDTSAQPEQRVL